MHYILTAARPISLCCFVVLIAGSYAAPSAAGEAKLLFYCPFDGSSKAAVAQGEAGTRRESGLDYQPGLFGQAVLIGPKGQLQYAEPGNLNKQRGTISLWFRPNWSGGANDPETRHVLFQEGPPPAKRLDSNQLWLWSLGSRMRFDVADSKDRYATSDITGWQAGEWHHIAATWDCRQGTAFYIDGRPIPRRGGGHPAKLFLREQRQIRFSWTPKEFPYFEIGGSKGHRTANGLIDELRIHDAPLAPDAIAREFRRIYPVTAKARRRYYPVGEESRFSWQAECNVSEPTQGSLEWFVQDAAGRTVVPLQREELKLTPGSYGRDFEGRLCTKASRPSYVDLPLETGKGRHSLRASAGRVGDRKSPRHQR